jgi:FkbM family methyltransferase
LSIIRIGDVAFICDDPWEKMRALSLDTKEPGTIAWLRATLKPGDVFYDIGANIGCYSLVAAQLVGPTGHVYAFEPHVFNAASLLRNIQVNGMQEVITVVTTPLDDDASMQPFHYTSLRPGSSGHQFGTVGAVSVLSASIRLGALGDVRRPDVIKIDVDGNELRVLRGLAFAMPLERPRSVQVEMAPASSGAIISFLQERGYSLTRRHYTHAGQQAIDRGADATRITDNAIFERVAVLA